MNNPYLNAYKQRVLRQCQLKQLGILKEIDRICKKHGITYWLDGGTLLGAVRHGGFIPWDDDIDIAMPADDLKRFIAIAPSELPAQLFLQTPDNEPTKEPIVKVRDLNSFYVEGSDNFAAPYEKGLFVDIFPFIPYPGISRKAVRRLTRGISKSYSILTKSHYYSLRSAAELFWFGGKYLLFNFVWKIACLVRPARKADNLGNILINNGYGIMHTTSKTLPVGAVKFEDSEFPAPRDVDAYLSDLYRNYMDVPPPEKRVIHSVFIMPDLGSDVATD